MKLNLKNLALVFLVAGTVSCDGREDLIKKLTEAQTAVEKPSENLKTYRKKMIHALSNPSCLIKKDFDLANIDLKCKDENPHEFYRLNIQDESKLAVLSEHCKKSKSLDGFKDNKLKAEIEAQYAIKKRFLEVVIYSIPGFSYYLGVVTDEFDKIVQSHIRKFIASSLVYDGKRLTFSALHKALEGILNAHEVDRKAIDGIKNAKLLLSNKDVKLTMFENIKGGFAIKPSAPDETANTTNKNTSVKEEKPINLVESALKASDKSTSSAEILGKVFAASLAISFGLLLFKSLTAKPAEDEEEEEMEEKH